MDKKEILDAVKKVKAEGKKRNFSQTYDLVINLKNLDLKKPENKVDVFLSLPYGKGKKVKVCALVDESMINDAKKFCDNAVQKTEFLFYSKDKKLAKKLASDYDFFVSQANLMPDVATAFGKVLGPKGKMPNPKAGCVVPLKVNLQPLVEKLQKTARLITKNELAIKCSVGTENMKEEEVAENIQAVLNQLLTVLPQGDNNVRNVLLKSTMGSPVKIGGKNA